MRVFVILPSPMPPEAASGAAHVVDRLCRALIGEGAEPTVLCRMARPPGDHGLKIDDEPGYTVIRAANLIAAAPFAVEETKPDVILVTTAMEHIWNLSHSVIDSGYPVAAWVIGGQLRPMLAPLDSRIALYGVSEYSARRAALCFEREARILLPPFFPIDFRVDTTRERVMFVNPIWPKGAEIAFRLAEHRPGVPFTFVESWPITTEWREHCFARATEMGNIDWYEPVTDMRTLYSRARVLLMPAVWEEAFGLVVLEAQASSIPVLASNRGGLPEAVGKGGILLDPHAPIGDWAAALDSLLVDGPVYGRLSRAAEKNSIKTEFQPRTIASALLESLDDLIDGWEA